MNKSTYVLIIDDEPSIRHMMGMVLSDEGYQVLEASNGQEAINNLKMTDELPALIFLDLRMPVMDGIEFRKQQLLDERLKSIPTVLLSADAHIETIAKKLKVNAFLPKLTDLETILELVNRYLNE